MEPRLSDRTRASPRSGPPPTAHPANPPPAEPTGHGSGHRAEGEQVAHRQMFTPPAGTFFRAERDPQGARHRSQPGTSSGSRRGGDEAYTPSPPSGPRRDHSGTNPDRRDREARSSTIDMRSRCDKYVMNLYCPYFYLYYVYHHISQHTACVQCI